MKKLFAVCLERCPIQTKSISWRFFFIWDQHGQPIFKVTKFPSLKRADFPGILGGRDSLTKQRATWSMSLKCDARQLNGPLPNDRRSLSQTDVNCRHDSLFCKMFKRYDSMRRSCELRMSCWQWQVPSTESFSQSLHMHTIPSPSQKNLISTVGVPSVGEANPPIRCGSGEIPSSMDCIRLSSASET